MIAAFPEFTKLTLDDKDWYDALVSGYPPFSDISFATLHIWWDLEGGLSISSLDGNLVINYVLPSDEKNSGYCLIGKHSVDSSIHTIFEELRRQHRPLKLVHVPDFVVEKIEHRHNLHFEEELDYNEYIVSSADISSLQDASHGRTRRKVNRFLREVEGRDVKIEALDLSSKEEREKILARLVDWEKGREARNDPNRDEHKAIRKTISHAAALGTQSLGLFIDGNLHAIILYHQPIDKKYYIINHLRVDYSIPFIFDYMTHHLAGRAVNEGVSFLNMEMDLGIEGLRRHKAGLRPIGFFKKYTVSVIS